MISEVDLIPTIPLVTCIDFNDFNSGQGYVDSIGEVRVRVNSKFYIHINCGVVEIRESSYWPLVDPVIVRHFKLIVKEI